MKLRSPGTKRSYQLNYRHRIIALLCICVTLALSISVRAIYLQLIGDKRLQNVARKQFVGKVLIRPHRGIILDRNNEPLAINTENESLAATPVKIKNKIQLAKKLGQALGVPAQKIQQRLQEKKDFVWIKRHLTEHERNQLSHFRVENEDGDLAAGLFLIKESSRVYPHGELLSHVLGGVNIDTEGIEGIELQENERLRGKVVSMSAIRDALGRPTFINADAIKDSREGESVTLTIDASLQYMVESELRAAVIRTGSRAGSAVIMSATTGEILALANAGPGNVRFRKNHVVTDGFEPGSILKPLLYAGAFEHGQKLSSRYHGENGQITIQGKKISEAETHEKFKWLTLKDALKLSSNVIAAKLALKLGTEAYRNTLLRFGLGAKTGIDFPGEISGKLPPKKTWSPLTLANVGFGQGLLATSLQLFRAYAIIANGGYAVEPQIIKRAQPPGSSGKRLFSAESIRDIRLALESVTEKDGTGEKAAIEGYRIAGKTGTAQVAGPGGRGYLKGKYISSFIGFPIDVEPKLVVSVVLHEPRGLYYASQTAAPLFRSILIGALNRFGIPPKEVPKPVLAQSGDPSRKTSVQKPHQKTEQMNEQKLIDTLRQEIAAPAYPEADSNSWVLPSFRGLSTREAIQLLSGRQVQLEIIGEGVIKAQTPPEGAPISENEKIRLYLGPP